MLIAVTNQCAMGCRHCMQHSKPGLKDTHMTLETFRRALEYTAAAERLIPEYRWVLLTGGEATEHPHLLEFIDAVFEAGRIPILLTNGQRLGEDLPFREEVLKRFRGRTGAGIQRVHDPRFYPKPIVKFEDPAVLDIEAVSKMIPLGRYEAPRNRRPEDPPLRRGPSSFNLRSVTISIGFLRAIREIRLNAMAGNSGNCTPSIDWEGNVRAGETLSCEVIGNVYRQTSDFSEEYDTIRRGRCGRCGLLDTLSDRERYAIRMPRQPVTT